MQSAIFASQYGQRDLNASSSDDDDDKDPIQIFSDCLLASDGSANISSQFSTAIEMLPSHIFTELVFDDHFLVHVCHSLHQSIFSKVLTRAMQHHPRSLGTLLNIHFIEDDQCFYILDFVNNRFGTSFLVNWMNENGIPLVEPEYNEFRSILTDAGANSHRIQNLIALHPDRADDVLANYDSADFDETLPRRISSAINMLPSYVFTEMNQFSGSSESYPFMVYVCLQFNRKVFYQVLSQAIRHHRHSAGTLLTRWLKNENNEFNYVFDPVVDKFGYSSIYNFLKEKEGITLMSNNYETFRVHLKKTTRHTLKATTH